MGFREGEGKFELDSSLLFGKQKGMGAGSGQYYRLGQIEGDITTPAQAWGLGLRLHKISGLITPLQECGEDKKRL